MIDLVCSVCGSNRWGDVQHSVDSRWPVARCPDHHDRTQIWTPLISARAYKAKTRRPKSAIPEDLFGGLSEDQRADLRKAVKLR